MANNNTDDKVDAGVLDGLGRAIKDTNTEPITGRANNNTDVEVDAGLFMGKTINKMATELNIDRFCRGNTIIEKEVCESNLF